MKTTFAHFGLAYYLASVLEHEIVNTLAVNRLVAAEQLLSDPWDDKFKATMGALVKQLEAHTQADPELAADLIEALQLRNHLAHAFWRDRAEDFCTEDGRARMIAYLIEARKHFKDVPAVGRNHRHGDTAAMGRHARGCRCLASRHAQAG